MSKISRFLCFGSDSRYKNRYKKDLKHVKFSRNYFLDFFARYGWKWGIHKGNKKYFPEKVIQDEVNRIRERMKISLQTILRTQTKPRFLSTISEEILSRRMITSVD